LETASDNFVLYYGDPWSLASVASASCSARKQVTEMLPRVLWPHKKRWPKRWPTHAPPSPFMP